MIKMGKFAYIIIRITDIVQNPVFILDVELFSLFSIFDEYLPAALSMEKICQKR